MKTYLKEPLVHFLLLGAALFVLYGFRASFTPETKLEEIVISRGQIEHMAAGFAKTWRRPPTPEELTGLVRDRIQEEVYCREAIALGLDKDDIVIRRRLRQKMEFISEDIVSEVEPTDAELLAYLNANPDFFRIERRYDFQHVFLNPQKQGENLDAEAARLLELLKTNDESTQPAELGDSFLLGYEFTDVATADLRSQFGGTFANAISSVEPGDWAGPIESGYGKHIVKITRRTHGRVPELDEVRDVVVREWEEQRRTESNAKFYEDLLKKYTITIEEIAPQ